MEDKGVQVNFNFADSNITESNDKEFLSDQISNLNISKLENKDQSEFSIDSDNLQHIVSFVYETNPHDTAENYISALDKKYPRKSILWMLKAADISKKSLYAITHEQEIINALSEYEKIKDEDFERYILVVILEVYYNEYRPMITEEMREKLFKKALYLACKIDNQYIIHNIYRIVRY